MTDGWYKVTRPNGNVTVEQVHNNRVGYTPMSSVARYQEDGCSFEEVEIMTKREVQELIRRTIEANCG
jgi:hypothetical protein